MSYLFSQHVWLNDITDLSELGSVRDRSTRGHFIPNSPDVEQGRSLVDDLHGLLHDVVGQVQGLGKKLENIF